MWRFLTVLVDKFSNLINNNKILPLSGLVVLLIMASIIWRLPETELAEIIRLLINEFITGKGGLIFLLVATNAGWFYLLKRSREIDQREIDRLSAIRSELMHKDQKTTIKKHRSTNGACEESYILPGPRIDKEGDGQ
ncbi:hypothetical protein [Desulfobotulus mexicanus]|nr:hypothetical protein [Desulfobotulus mexicanus]